MNEASNIAFFADYMKERFLKEVTPKGRALLEKRLEEIAKIAEREKLEPEKPPEKTYDDGLDDALSWFEEYIGKVEARLTLIRELLYGGGEFLKEALMDELAGKVAGALCDVFDETLDAIEDYRKALTPKEGEAEAEAK